MRTSSSTAKRLLKLIAGISVMTMCAASSVFAAEQLPEFSAPTLTEADQASQAWTNVVPNALAPYYTYQPLSAADATALGWPASLNCGTAADCYIISVRQFGQPTSLDFLKYVGIPGFPGNGLLKTDGTPFVRTDTLANFQADAAAGNLTTAWGYGSGGAGWQPYYPTLVNGAAGITGNAPPPFQGVPFNSLFGAGQNGDPNATGLWHFPAPTIKGTRGRPVHVQWLNDLPNSRPQGHDPTVDCGTAAHFCYPYNRIVTHVHGAHVLPQSDGLAVAWYTPNYALTGEGAFAPTANFYASTPLNATPIYTYPMDQEASTIWYHDHAVGTTHLNTNMGMAGFFPITDTHEQSLYASGALPATDFEHGFALQDRHFNTSAQMVMPDSAIYDKTTPGCVDDANGLPDPTTCTRLNFMKDPAHGNMLVPWPGVDPLNPTPAEILMAADPINACGAGETQDFNNRFEGITLAGVSFNQCAPFPGVSATLEYFGNMPVVNGVTYGQYTLEKRVHRMRFIGGTDSRTWVMSLVRDDIDATGSLDANGFKTFNPAAVIPFWQIGSEQGLLNAPVQRDFIDIMGGERIDVLVDLTDVPAGTTLTLHNVGADGPYTGIFELGIEPSSTLIPEIMKFNVVAATAAPNSTRPSASAPVLRPTPIVVPTPAAGEPVRNVALIEITDQYGRTMPTVDARGYIVPGMMVTEYIKQNSTEQWDIINTTVDAHPMHIHQVAFITLDRAAILSFDPPESNTITKTFSQSSYTAGPSLGLGAHDAGWKDTIQCPPGHVTRVVATWDLEGEYVWHCHILSHEEHDMMRPFQVVAASAAAPPAWLGVQANNGQGKIKLWWPGVAGASGYVIHESTVANFATSRYAVTVHGSGNSALLELKSDGTYYYRIAAIINGAQTGYRQAAGPVTLAKTVVAPAWIGASMVKSTGLAKVWWAASTTPSTFESTQGNLYYPVDYLVTYDVTATNTVNPLLTYTTTGITATTAMIGQAPDPVTGAVLPLPNGPYTFSVVANKVSFKPSSATSTAGSVTVNNVLAAPAWLGVQKAGVGVKLWWPTIAGATMQIVETFTPTVGTPVVTTLAPTILTSGSLSYFVQSKPTGGTYSYTIQNVTPNGFAFSAIVNGSASVALP